MKLKLRVRHSSANSTCFARLHPRTAQLLHSEALSRAVHSSDDVNADDSGEGSKWLVEEEGELTQFLPLRILGVGSFETIKAVYVSYNGGHCDEGKSFNHRNALFSYCS